MIRKRPWWDAARSDLNPLDLVEGYVVGAAIVELGRAGRGVGGDDGVGLDLAAYPVMENLLVPIAPPGHPLSGAATVPLAAFAGEPFLVREAGSGTRDAIERAFAEHGLTVNPAMELGSTESIKRAVMAGLGVSVLSLSSLELEIEAGLPAPLRVEGLPLRLTWFAVHLRDKHLGPTANAFLSQLMTDREATAHRIGARTPS